MLKVIVCVQYSRKRWQKKRDVDSLALDAARQNALSSYSEAFYEVRGFVEERECVMIHQVLVATDGSENALRAARFSARVVAGQITVVFVHLPLLPPAAVPAPAPLAAPAQSMHAALHELSAEERAQAQEIVAGSVNEIRRALGETSVDVSGRVVIAARVDEGILHVAEEIKADLIIVGTRGLGPLRGAILGSVSHSLIEKAHCPVLVVK